METKEAIMTTTATTTGATKKRSAVDEAFERMFGYTWGTKFDIDDNKSNDTPVVNQLVQIFGHQRAARILGIQGSRRKRLKIAEPTAAILNYKDLKLPSISTSVASTTESKVFAGQVIQTTTKKPEGAAAAEAATKPATNLDNVLAQIAGPSKMSTIKKTSDDWEQFKESDKQLQDELEKKAQGKDAFLVKQDFLKRVDERKFEIEREERERERAKRTTT